MNLATEEVTPGVTKINLTGRLDIAGTQAIDLDFNALVDSQRAIIVDLAEVAFIASMGLRTLSLARAPLPRSMAASCCTGRRPRSRTC